MLAAGRCCWRWRCDCAHFCRCSLHLCCPWPNAGHRQASGSQAAPQGHGHGVRGLHRAQAGAAWQGGGGGGGGGCCGEKRGGGGGRGAGGQGLEKKERRGEGAADLQDGGGGAEGGGGAGGRRRDGAGGAADHHRHEGAAGGRGYGHAGWGVGRGWAYWGGGSQQSTCCWAGGRASWVAPLAVETPGSLHMPQPQRQLAACTWPAHTMLPFFLLSFLPRPAW